jgi:hypothetical protein
MHMIMTLILPSDFDFFLVLEKFVQGNQVQSQE